MKRLACLILILAMLTALCACGAPDPNCGVYVAQQVDIGTYHVAPNLAFDGGLSVELKNGGRGVITMGDEKGSVRWSLDGEALTISDSNNELTGTLVDGTMVLDMGSDTIVTLIKER